MIEIHETDYSNILYMEVYGRISQEDAEKSDTFIKEHYADETTVNALVDVKNLEGTDLGGLLKGMVVDIKHWNQYGKFAVITDSAWIEGGAKTADAAPGIEVKQFDRSQNEDAWKWLQS